MQRVIASLSKNFVIPNLSRDQSPLATSYLLDLDLSTNLGRRRKYLGVDMERYRERPSLWHVVVTCFALLYLLYFISGWMLALDNPDIRHTTYFWSAWIAFGMGLAWIAGFLIRELIRQARLFRQWNRT